MSKTTSNSAATTTVSFQEDEYDLEDQQQNIAIPLRFHQPMIQTYNIFKTTTRRTNSDVLCITNLSKTLEWKQKENNIEINKRQNNNPKSSKNKKQQYKCQLPYYESLSSSMISSFSHNKNKTGNISTTTALDKKHDEMERNRLNKDLLQDYKRFTKEITEEREIIFQNETYSARVIQKFIMRQNCRRSSSTSDPIKKVNNQRVSKKEIRKTIAGLYERLGISSLNIDGLTLTQDDIVVHSDDDI